MKGMMKAGENVLRISGYRAADSLGWGQNQAPIQATRASEKEGLGQLTYSPPNILSEPRLMLSRSRSQAMSRHRARSISRTTSFKAWT
jgi:hypothetical protein